MIDSESDASDTQAQISSIPEIQEGGEKDNKITDAAAAKSQDNGSTQSTPQQEKDQSIDTHEWNGERFILEYCCGLDSRIDKLKNCVDNS
eukprot:9326508-Pyramimonas_sp.AAC.1